MLYISNGICKVIVLKGKYFATTLDLLQFQIFSHELTIVLYKCHMQKSKHDSIKSITESQKQKQLCSSDKASNCHK